MKMLVVVLFLFLPIPTDAAVSDKQLRAEIRQQLIIPCFRQVVRMMKLDEQLGMDKDEAVRFLEEAEDGEIVDQIVRDTANMMKEDGGLDGVYKDYEGRQLFYGGGILKCVEGIVGQ